jgi:hypothetical protein
MWQPAVLPGITRLSRSAERKAAAVAYVRTRFGVAVDSDAADAVCLGVYVARNARRGGCGAVNRPRNFDDVTTPNRNRRLAIWKGTI